MKIECVVDNAGGTRVNQSSKESASAEAAKVSAPAGANSAVVSQPQRDQRSRFESKTGSVRKQVSDSKPHEETFNGTSA